jgi:simple sugar transport system permease protein
MTTSFAAAVLSSSVVSGTSLLYATLGELVGERAGIVNLGLEGVMLIGASIGFAVCSTTGDPYFGVAAAAFGGMGAALLFGYIVIGRRANQLASGLTLLFFGFGVSALIGRPFIGASITGLPRLALPGVGAFDLLVWLAVPTAVLLWWLLFRTRWGLALRAVGEDPAAAFAAGRRPDVIQYQALAVGGLLGGIGWRWR